MYFNHFSDLQIYGNETISMYRGKNMGDLDPHVYAVAEGAFKRMERYLWGTLYKNFSVAILIIEPWVLNPSGIL